MLRYKDWKEETAYDILAFGSIVFYILVIVRALIGPFFPFIYQLFISLIFLFLISLAVDFDGYLARGVVLTVFTSIFYNNRMYIVFVILFLIGMITSSFYLRIDKKKIIKGLIMGMIGVILAYYCSLWIMFG